VIQFTPAAGEVGEHQDCPASRATTFGSILMLGSSSISLLTFSIAEPKFITVTLVPDVLSDFVQEDNPINEKTIKETVK